jgi:hypothetical protein
MPTRPVRVLPPLLAASLCLLSMACASATPAKPIVREPSSSGSVRPASPVPSPSFQSPRPDPDEEATTALVTLFTGMGVAGDLCGPLEPRNAKLRDASPSGAVRAVVHSRAFQHLELSDPELQIEEATARVELHGHGHPLSRCEQISLLGAIRMTLQINERWGIRQVVFTSGGNLLAI